MACLSVNTKIVSVCLDVDVKRCDKLNNVGVAQFNTPLLVNVSSHNIKSVTATKYYKNLNVTYSLICAPHYTGTIFIVDPLELEMPYSGDAVYVTVTSNRNWEIPEGNNIPWNEGDGFITATYTGKGNDYIQFTSNINEGIDRQQFVSVQVVKGKESEQVHIKQIGLREIFVVSDGDFTLADSGTFNVLKNEL